VAAASVARVGDDLADPAAHRAWPRRHHLAEQPALDDLDLPPPASGVPGDRCRIAIGALALAEVTQHRGVNGHLLGHAGGTFSKVEPHAQQRIRTRLDPAERTAGGCSAAEEGLEHVAQPAETAEDVA